MSSKAKQVRSEYPTVRTSNTGRRYVEVRDLLRSEAGRNEIKKQAANDGSMKQKDSSGSDPHPPKG
jgi:hypothetical protein